MQSSCEMVSLAMSHFQEKNIKLLSRPGNSPDMNSIDNVCKEMDYEIHEMKFSNKHQLIERFNEVWHRNPRKTEIANKNIASMTDRMTAVIKAKGGHSGY